ncbi:MAG TPA: 4'-phosphopantetheinyl transferase superfamily protein [Spirochaetota bacterium]|nr:4'-phosphopantetheinyl transferase superfamily protein [Spirochaetota bacterium]
MPSESGNKGVHSTIEKISGTVYLSSLRIPDFIESAMEGIVPGDYRTARGIDLNVFQPARKYCTDEELARVAKARSLKRQVEWLCGRVALKELLKSVKFPELDLRDIKIVYNESGKPYLCGHGNTGISISHSGDFAMAALHTVPGKKIGIDIEKYSGTDLEAVMSVAFTPEERAEYKDRPAKDIITVFTLKEAYLKIRGQGFHETITRVSVKENRIFFDNAEVKGITTEIRKIDREYILSIIYES